MGHRRRRTRNKAATAAHPSLWPYLAGVTALLLVVAILGTRHLRDEQARFREMLAEDASRRARDSAASDRPTVRTRGEPVRPLPVPRSHAGGEGHGPSNDTIQPDPRFVPGTPSTYRE